MFDPIPHHLILTITFPLHKTINSLSNPPHHIYVGEQANHKDKPPYPTTLLSVCISYSVSFLLRNKFKTIYEIDRKYLTVNIYIILSSVIIS